MYCLVLCTGQHPLWSLTVSVLSSTYLYWSCCREVIINIIQFLGPDTMPWGKHRWGFQRMIQFCIFLLAVSHQGEHFPSICRLKLSMESGRAFSQRMIQFCIFLLAVSHQGEHFPSICRLKLSMESGRAFSRTNKSKIYMRLQRRHGLKAARAFPVGDPQGIDLKPVRSGQGLLGHGRAQRS